jgi:hypothetical protein
MLLKILYMYLHLPVSTASQTCRQIKLYNSQMKARLDLKPEDGGVGERLRHHQTQEAQHGNAPVPTLCPGCEGAEAASICRLPTHDGHQRRVREQLHRAQKVQQPRLARIRHLLKHSLPGHLLHHHRPHEPQHRLPTHTPSQTQVSQGSWSFDRVTWKFLQGL